MKQLRQVIEENAASFLLLSRALGARFFPASVFRWLGCRLGLGCAVGVADLVAIPHVFRDHHIFKNAFTIWRRPLHLEHINVAEPVILRLGGPGAFPYHCPSVPRGRTGSKQTHDEAQDGLDDFFHGDTNRPLITKTARF